jgi:uncharacterized protein with FMN-binding domain
MEGKKPAAVLCVALATSCMTMSGCAGTTTEGSGSGEAATAEQLAMTLEDPWDAPNSVQRTLMEGNYNNGTYTGIGQGMDGWIKVTVTIENNYLQVDSITQEGESQGRGGYEAIRDGIFADRIEQAQGADIDAISGATVTSEGVVEALQNALAQAEA